jgi:hypothetical protein
MILKGILTDANLSKLFNVTPATVSTWRKRNSTPFEKILTICKAEGFSLQFVFHGEGPKYADEKITDTDCVIFLIIQSMKESGIRLTPKGLQKIQKIIQEDVWGEMKSAITDVLTSLVKAMPRWKSEEKPGKDKKDAP